jgi:glycosyltransferase involved in cell wall biosynthesis
MILQFADIQHPSQGGLFSVVQMFRQILGGAIVETIPLNHIGQTFGDYQITVNNRGVLKSYPLPIQHQNVLKQIDPQKISLVVIHGLWRVHTTLGYQFAKSHQLPYLLVPHGMLDPYVFTYRAWQKKIWLSLVGQQIINGAAAIICATQREAEKASPYLKAARIEFCTWGISTPDWQKQAIWRAEIRTKLGVSQQQRILIFLGRLHRMKRPIETAKAFQKLQLSEWVMLFVGFIESGGGTETIEELCDGKFIRYHPPVSGLEKWKFLSAADAFVNLSHRENFGLTVAEAAAAGLPLLISDDVDIASILQQAGGADVITIGLKQSNQKLEVSLSQFLQKSPTEHTQMGIKAKQAFENNFRMSQFAHHLLKIVETYKKSVF